MKKKEFTLKFSETIPIEKLLIDLIPIFLKNKLIDLQMLQSVLDKQDFQELKNIGHKWKGTCSSYGFHYLSAIGGQIENLSENKNHSSLQCLLNSLEIYFKNINITYYRAPIL